MLVPVLDWLLRQHLPNTPLRSAVADYRHLPRRPKGLAERIRLAVWEYPCDLLFVHRDAENESADHRRAEIQDTLDDLKPPLGMPHICLIPIRMSEAWLLTDETAIRAAAANRYGKKPLAIPKTHQIEGIADPKTLLYGLLKTASELSGRRLDKLHPGSRVQLVAENTEDFSPLRRLKAFGRLEEEVKAFVTSHVRDTDFAA